MTRIKSYWLIFVIIRTLFNLNHSKEQKSVFIQKLPLPSKTEFQLLVIKANMSHCNVIETNSRLDHIIKTYCQYHVVVDDRFYLKRKMKINNKYLWSCWCILCIYCYRCCCKRWHVSLVQFCEMYENILYIRFKFRNVRKENIWSRRHHTYAKRAWMFIKGIS